MNKRQRDYVLSRARMNLGSDTMLDKPTIMKFAEGAGLIFKKNIAKASLLDMICANEELADEFCQSFSWAVPVSGYDLAMQERLTYNQIQELEQMGVLEIASYNKKNYPMYTIEALGHEVGYLKEKWEEIFIKGYHRTRIEVQNTEEVMELMEIFSKDFEIVNVSQLYPLRDKKGYHIYFSIRKRD